MSLFSLKYKNIKALNQLKTKNKAIESDLTTTTELASFDKLKQQRALWAKERNVPAYVVFHDATLIEIARKSPINLSQLLAVNGLGKTKLELIWR